MSERPDKIDWGNTDVIEPSGSKKATGWLKLEKPAYQFLNWLFRQVSLDQFYVFGQSQEFIVISSNADEQDYATLEAYIADSPAPGDQVLVKETQVLTIPMIIPLSITVRFLEGVEIQSSLDVPAGALITLSDLSKIKGKLDIRLTNVGTVQTVIKYNGANAYVEHVFMRLDSTGTITNVVEIVGDGSYGYFNAADVGGGTITNFLTDSSGNESNLVYVVDRNTNVTHRSDGVDHVGLADDSDLLDGQNSSFYRNAGNLNAGTLPAARFNDTAHGNRAGGSLHPDAIAAGAAGFMSGADKTKLDGLIDISSPTVQSTGSQSVVAGATWTPLAGVYQVAVDNNIAGAAGELHLELFISAAWKEGVQEGIGMPSGIIFMDGTNMRFHNSYGVATVTTWWQKF